MAAVSAEGPPQRASVPQGKRSDPIRGMGERGMNVVLR